MADEDFIYIQLTFPPFRANGLPSKRMTACSVAGVPTGTHKYSNCLWRNHRVDMYVPTLTPSHEFTDRCRSPCFLTAYLPYVLHTDEVIRGPAVWFQFPSFLIHSIDSSDLDQWIYTFLDEAMGSANTLDLTLN